MHPVNSCADLPPQLSFQDQVLVDVRTVSHELSVGMRRKLGASTKIETYF